MTMLVVLWYDWTRRLPDAPPTSIKASQSPPLFLSERKRMMVSTKDEQCAGQGETVLWWCGIEPGLIWCATRVSALLWGAGY